MDLRDRKESGAQDDVRHCKESGAHDGGMTGVVEADLSQAVLLGNVSQAVLAFTLAIICVSW